MNLHRGLDQSWKKIFDQKQLGRVLRLREAVALVWHSAPIWTIASLVLTVLQGLLPLVSLYLMKLIIDTIASDQSLGKEGSFNRLVLLVSLAGAVALFSILIRNASSLVTEVQSFLVSDYVQDILHSKSVDVDLEYYESPSYYDTLHRAQQEAPTRPIHIIGGLTQLLQSGISMVSMFILLISLSWAVAAALIIASIPVAVVRLIYSNKFYRWRMACTINERKAWYLHWLLTDQSCAKEVRIFNLGQIFRDKYRSIRRQLLDERINLNLGRSVADTIAQAIGLVALFASLFFIATLGLVGSITVGDIVMYFGAVQQAQGSFSSVLSALAGLYEDSLFLTYLYDFLEIQPKVKEPILPSEMPKPMRTGISFQGVSFCYPDAHLYALKDVNLSIKPGQTIALVGENGSGKTTLVKLLCRLYDPQKGSIMIDGIDLKNLRVPDLRREISVIFQDYFKYNMTAAENIWLGSAETPLDQAQVMAAAKASGAAEFIGRLEDGYQTVLGKWFDDGTDLSIGEWQKVALARAFMRDSQIIILDEPTSSLDPKAEAKVFSKLKELLIGKTTIIISHRLSTVKLADLIIFMKDGCVTEMGTHAELMALGGDFADLFEIQASKYR
jgi:ATP-binding cassette, subfamily B, bacterial